MRECEKSEQSHLDQYGVCQLNSFSLFIQLEEKGEDLHLFAKLWWWVTSKFRCTKLCAVQNFYDKFENLFCRLKFPLRAKFLVQYFAITCAQSCKQYLVQYFVIRCVQSCKAECKGRVSVTVRDWAPELRERERTRTRSQWTLDRSVCSWESILEQLSIQKW